jgi:hypothetical protein
MTTDDAAFQAWWDEYRLVSWQRGLMDDEKNKPMPPNWARGNEVYVRLGWDAHRVYGVTS